MEHLWPGIKFFAAGLAAALTTLLGGADTLLYTLIVFTIADYLSGVAKAIVCRQLGSFEAFRGGIKKIMIYVVVAVAVGLDSFLPSDGTLFRSLTIGYYIATEGISILENVALCGLPLPQKLRDTLAQAKEDHS